MTYRHDAGDKSGKEMHDLVAALYPIHRSMTGNGVRQTLDILKNHIPVQTHEVPSGTVAFDWQVPLEWNVADAYVKDESGARVVDFTQSNLHLVSYSQPVDAVMSWSELKEHLHTLPKHPDWIPYRTSHFKESWGLCLSHRRFLELDALGDRSYHVRIDATMTDGSLTYGEFSLPGTSRDEVLVSCHTCHPSLANDNLSGIAVAVFLAKYLARAQRRLTYRFIFIPATIGAITWLCRNERRAENIKHGLVLSLLGDAGSTTYKKSRQGDAKIDRVVEHVLQHSQQEYEIMDFEPTGYDERQFCSPGFNLPVGCFMRTRNGYYPEYHTSADNLDLVQPESLADSLQKAVAIMETLEGDLTYRNQKPKCEARLDGLGLYSAYGDAQRPEELQQAALWLLNMSDGTMSLLDIAERSGLPFTLLKKVTDTLAGAGLLAEVPSQLRTPAGEKSADVEKKLT